MGGTLDFTKPWMRGQRVIPRRGDTPPRLENIIKVVPIIDPETKRPVVPKIVSGVPNKAKPWIEPNGTDKSSSK